MAEGAAHVIFVGITCGLSAPYVAGQIDAVGCGGTSSDCSSYPPHHLVRLVLTSVALASFSPPPLAHKAMAMDNCTTVLIGFNPVSLARDAPVESWDQTCAQVFQRLAAQEESSPERFCVLNPVRALPIP